MLSILSFVKLNASLKKYIAICMILIISHSLVYIYTKNTCEIVATKDCTISKQNDQILIQNENIKHTQKAKQISKNNSLLERDTLIDAKL